MRLVSRSENLAGFLEGREKVPAGALAFSWLGQAGFVIFHGESSLAIDPYLSDSLHAKYGGTQFPHRRMMSPPISPASLSGVDVLFSTHAHTDHLDPGTLGEIYEKAGDSAPLAVCARSAAATAMSRGIPAARLLTMDAGETHRGVGWEVSAIQSAHENLAGDEFGSALFLGYVIRLGSFTIYHSGDCIPYQGLAETLAASKPDLALLPVNGRDDRRRSANIPGNFTAEEAAELARSAGAGFLVPHHYGMFDFNTADPAEVRGALEASGRRLGLDALMSEPGVVYTMDRP